MYTKTESAYRAASYLDSGLKGPEQPEHWYYQGYALPVWRQPETSTTPDTCGGDLPAAA